MNKLYNTQKDIATNLNNFFNKVCTSLSKVHLKILPYIIIGMIDSESVVTNDIIKKLKGHWALVKNDSNQKRLRRFFNSNTFNIYNFYDSIIKHIILRFNPRKNDSIHISFDHCFCKSKFTILAFSLRIGKQAIPLWFKCFKGTTQSEAFTSDTIIDGINYIADLFKYFDCKLVFLADRFFDTPKIMKHINSINHIFVIRAKGDILSLIYDKKEGHSIRKKLGEIKAYSNKSILLYDVPITSNFDYIVNIAVSKSNDVKEPWILLTNGDPKKAIKFYGYRWSIECFFKNQKSNGFYLESTNVRNINAFSCIFGLSCISLIWLTTLGSYYSRNKGRKSNFITDIKIHKGVNKRMISLFNVGLIYFNLAYNSIKYCFIGYRFALYDV